MADNCEPRKIDSNNTGLSFAETICGVLPTIEDDGRLPTWYELEPNSYADFGGGITTTARTPINASRQRKKGVTTDLNAGGGFNQDYTKSNFNRLMQGFLFADAHEKPTTAPLNGLPVEVTGAASGTNTYTAVEGLARFRAGQLVMVTGFFNAANNGVKTITGVADDAITVTEALETETAPGDVVISVVGWTLAAGGANIAMVGALPQLELTGAAPVAASGTIEVVNAAAPESVTVGGIVYSFVAAIEDPYDVLVGADDSETAANFAAAVNGGVIGTPAHPFVTATVVGDTVTVTAIIPGMSGNDVDLSTDGDDIVVSGATLEGGTGFSFLEMGFIEGEWLYLGADDPNNRFANNTGYARIAHITDQALLFDKATWAATTEAGAGKTIHLWAGLTIRNEKDPDLITTRYYEFERTLGRDDVGVQTEYLTRAVPNEWTLNVPLPEGEEAKLNADVTFVAGDSEQRTGAEGRKPGPFVPAPGEDAFNTASHVVRMRMAVLDPATARPMPLFAYITEATIAINNNVTPVKAVGTLGSIDVNVGNFDVGGEVTAIFASVMATRAVRDNADVTLDFIVAGNNAGFVYDIPLLGLGGGAIDVEAGREVRVPLELMGAENPNGYTLLYTSWQYLPSAAMPKAGTDY